MIKEQVIIRDLGLTDYLATWQMMQQFTIERDIDTLDEIWLLQHPSIFTQGQNGKSEHLLTPHDIPVIKVDRGGQVTYHGPGQLVVYTLIDLQRKQFTIRYLVNQLEKSIIEFLKEFNIEALSTCNAPGVYIHKKKICSIGLRIKRGRSFHGLALNVNMDLEPFMRINPCGFSGLEMTQVSAYTPDITVEMVKDKVIKYLITNLGYNQHFILPRKVWNKRI